MLIGRAILGVGIGSVYSILSKFISGYFKGGLLAFALGLNLGCGCFFDSFNVAISPRIVEKYSISFTLELGIYTCILSLFSCIVAIMMDFNIEDTILNNINPKESIKQNLLKHDEID
jgi:hypothetical protein